jgi:hypothetical protein
MRPFGGCSSDRPVSHISSRFRFGRITAPWSSRPVSSDTITATISASCTRSRLPRLQHRRHTPHESDAGDLHRTGAAVPSAARSNAPS